MAETFSNESGDNRIVLHLNKYGNKPSSPSQYIIECEYSDGNLIVYLSDNLEFVSVSLEIDQFYYYLDCVTADDNVVDVSNWHGLFNVICTTPDNQDYFGQIFFD